MDAIERLCARNEQISKGYLQSSPKFIRDFAEWHSRDLSSHINGLYDQAVALRGAGDKPNEISKATQISGSKAIGQNWWSRDQREP